MTSERNRLYWYWLASSTGGTVAGARDLLAQEMELEELFRQARKLDLEALGVKKKHVEPLRKRAEFSLLERELDGFARRGIRIVGIMDKEYPALLREIYEAPMVLYVKGDLFRCTKRMVSMIGTRRPKRQNVAKMQQLAKELAREGVTVVSGMARGLDSAAQRGALQGGGATVAVLGGGVDVIYPPENRRLYEEIVERGALISEAPPGTAPRPYLFPRRNRIISGMSQALVVGEGNVKSGAAITAAQAKEQSRDIFALLPEEYDPENDLPSSLIESGVPVVMNVNTILRAYGWGTAPRRPREEESTSVSGLDFLEEALYNQLLKGEKTTEELMETLQQPAGTISLTLTKLELKGLITRLPGDFFGRKI